VTPPPRVQPWAGLQNVIARSVTDTDEIGRIQEQCVDAFSPHAASQQHADFYADIITNLFHYAVCDSSWRIQGNQKI
jgi:hypothetical protein